MTYNPGDIILNKYRIEALIGQGAFAEVYRVKHLQLNVTRAIKILSRETPGIGSTEFNECLGRFQLEAQLGAMLNTPSPHPNLIQVYDFQQAGELLILEMEYAPGGSLAERIAKVREAGTNFPIDEILPIAQDMASGLAAIHNQDIIHRDIKPSNILFDREGRAKIADLGLAQIPGGPSMRSRISEPLPHPGTPGYMSPEQHHQREYLTPSSDMYALALVIFEMYTGRFYHNLRAGTRASQLQHNIPPWLDDLISFMLSLDSKERPWDGGEALRLLKLQGKRDKRSAAKLNPRLRSTWSLILGSVVLLICTGSIVVMIWGLNAYSAGGGLTIFPPRSSAASSLIPATTIAEISNTPTHSPEPAETDVPAITPTNTLEPTDTIIATITPTKTPQSTDTPVPQYPSASFTYPQNKDSVGWKVNVSGYISGLEPGYRAFMCIQSTVFGELIWPQGEILPDSTGYWVVEGVYQSVGYDYRSFVVITNNHDSAEKLADQYYRAMGMNELPPDTTVISPIIVVARR
jgi:serine/threonine protein kinase